MGKVIPGFEDLLFSIISNGLVKGSSFKINKENAKSVAKGLIINRLLTTYKLKNYIMDQLSKHKISPNVSLSEYH